MKTYIPTRRTLEKFLRDGGLGFISAGLVYLGDNLANLGIPPEFVPFVGVVVQLAYRVVRGARGLEPA